MGGVLRIDKKMSPPSWMPTAGVFDFTVERMGALMQEERLDIAQKFLDSTEETNGISFLNIEDFPLADKEYVLTILVKLRQVLIDESKIYPGKINYEGMDKRLSDFEALLRQSIERMKSESGG